MPAARQEGPALSHVMPPPRRVSRRLIEQRLRGAMPGADPARIDLSGSRAWPESWQSGADLRPAGVLVPLVERRAGLTVLLTRRSSELTHHAGQVSFPGGTMEDHDADILQTALRETYEEIGVPPDAVTVAGALRPMPTITGYAVTPIVGLLPEVIRLRLDPAEVERAFEVPLAFLMDERNERRSERVIEGVPVPLLEFAYGGERIWGATAAMLAELRFVLYKK